MTRTHKPERCGFADLQARTWVIRAFWIPGFLGVAAASTAQVEDRTRPAPAANAPLVYLNDSFEARDLILRASRFADRGQWPDAAETMRLAVRKFADKLIQLEPGLYVGVPDYVNRKIAEWPAEGVRAFNDRYREEALEACEKAIENHDLTALLRVVDEYFSTDAGIKGAAAAGELAIERGDFELALRVFGRIVSLHPQRDRVLAEFQGRMAVTHALAGKFDEADRWLADLATGESPPIILWMGSPTPIAGVIDQIRAGAFSPPPESDDPDWPVIFGNAAHNRALNHSTPTTAPLWTFSGFDPTTIVGASSSLVSASFLRSLKNGRFLSFYPVVANGAVYFHDAARVWALSASTGAVLWVYDEISLSNDTESGGENASPLLYACAAAGGRVFARLGGGTTSYFGFNPAKVESVLVALDAATGAVLWSTGTPALGRRFGEMEFNSPPLPYMDQLYIVMRRQKSFGFEDCYLVRLDAATGKFIWQTHLGSASTGGFGYRQATFTIPSISDGTIYACSNLGTVAAVSADTGHVRWLRLYDRRPAAASGDDGDDDAPIAGPWEYNPTLLSDGTVICLPLDSDRMLSLNAGDGAIRSSVARSDLLEVQSLAGVVDGVLYGVGRGVFGWNLREKSLVMSHPIPGEARLYGRPCLTKRSLLAPTREALVAFQLDGGSPTVRPWEADSEGGNVVAVPDCVLVAGNNQITAWADKDEVFDRLQKRMKTAPDDVAAPLELAEIAFRTSDFDIGKSAFDAAIDRIGGFANLVDADLRTRVFNDGISFGDRLLALSPPDFEQAERFYLGAAQCPPDTAGHLLYRIKLAKLYEQAGRYPQAVQQLQQIVSDPSLRRAEFPDQQGRPALAGAAAQSEIESLISEHGRGVYAEVEAEARSRLDAAQSACDWPTLEQIIEAYPNSTAAPQAMVLQAQWMRQQRQYRQAAGLYYTAYVRFRSAVQGPEIMKDIADCYLLAGRPEVAWQWLTIAARQFPDAAVEVDGRFVSFLEYRASLGNLVRRVEPIRPKLEGPLEASATVVHSETAAILCPSPSMPATRLDVYFIHDDKRLTAFRAASAEKLWTSDIEFREAPSLLMVDADEVVLGAQFELFGLSMSDGSLFWRFGSLPAGLDDPAIDPETLTPWYDFKAGRRMLAALRSASAVALDPGAGVKLWEGPLEYAPAGISCMSAEWVVYASFAGGKSRWCALDASTGRLVHAIDAPNNEVTLQMMLTVDGTLLVASTQSVYGCDPHAGRILWSAPENGGNMTAGMQVDVDGIYVASEGRRVTKLSTIDGRALWTSSQFAGRLWDGLQTMLDEGILYLASPRGLVAVDAVDGRVLWEKQPSDGGEYVYHAVCDRHVLAVERNDSDIAEKADFRVIVYGKQDGAVDKAYGAQGQDLGRHEGDCEFHLLDNALILRAGAEITTYRSRPE